MAELLAAFRADLNAFAGDYAAEKIFSAVWDGRFGFEKARVESSIQNRSAAETWRGEQAWLGLPLPSLETPYPELWAVLKEVSHGLRDDYRLIDLGCAYARAAIVAAVASPRASFVGYELVAERTHEAKRVLKKLGLSAAHVITQNLAELTAIPPADVYFIYDLGSVERIRTLLAQLQARARHDPVWVIGRGRATRHFIETEHPWLSQVYPPTHFTNLSLYLSAPPKKRSQR